MIKARVKKGSIKQHSAELTGAVLSDSLSVIDNEVVEEEDQ